MLKTFLSVVTENSLSVVTSRTITQAQTRQKRNNWLNNGKIHGTINLGLNYVIRSPLLCICGLGWLLSYVLPRETLPTAAAVLGQLWAQTALPAGDPAVERGSSW